MGDAMDEPPYSSFASTTIFRNRIETMQRKVFIEVIGLDITMQ